MHISLDSALGRQRRLNSVGESVFQIAPNAAAGYSLRSLTGGDPAVVRVRRESDNAERDFNASGVSSGELVNWVNQQITPPLDLRELTATGRDGPIIDAAAAYSLRNLSDSYTGNVVEVRRSSDDATRSFTAAEVADGTLTDWVAEEQVGWNVQPTMEIAAGGGSITSQSSTSTSSTFTVSNTAGDSFLRVSGKPNSILAGTGDSVVVNISVSGLADSTILRLYTSASNTSRALQSVGNGNNQELTLSPNGQVGYLAFSEFNTTTEATVTINSIKVIGKTGFVSQWYDQSTTAGTPNANHAVQTDAASQPKIVDAGSLVTGGLDFDGVGDKLDLSGSGLDIFKDVGYGQVFTVITPERTSPGSLRYFEAVSGATGARFLLGDSQDYASSSRIGGRRLDSDSFQDIESSTSHGNNETLITGFLNWTDSDAYLYFNGTQVVSSTSFQTDGNTSNTSSASAAIGGVFNPGNFKMQELIIYNTDQTDNRTAIEANIGEVYSIAGIPAYDDTVNGFVETWYDQSGNDNDAVQFTASNQPKIVDAGVYLGEVDFLDGTSTFLETTNSDLCNVSELSVFSVLKPHTAQSQVVAFSCGSVVSGSTVYGGWRLNLNGYLNNAVFQTQTIGNASSTSLSNNVSGNDTLVSYVANFPDAATFINGTAGSSTSSAISPFNSNTGRRRFRIGCQFTYQVSSFYTKPIKEIILYTSDQSANRAAIEANIILQYDI